jgi:hypothetical protein
MNMYVEPDDFTSLIPLHWSNGTNLAIYICDKYQF